MEIRRFTDADWPSLWPILQATIAAGDTFVFAPDTPEAAMRQAWVGPPAAVWVACVDGAVVGSYYLKPNQPGLGSHVCNGGYVVAPAARGSGIAAAMCEDSQREAVALGYRAMQFNFVVASNERAVGLWRRLGFETIGTLPRAFAHRRLGYVDALVMYKQLV